MEAEGASPLRGTLMKVITYAVFVACLAICGCVQVPVQEQRRVSKPNMGFTDSYVFNYESTLTGQVEPASGGTGEGKSTGCTSCK